jgi:type I restriction enzyme, S subunit
MVDSELGPIPEGWSVKPLEDVANVNERAIRPNAAPKQIRYIDIASVSTAKIDNIQLMDFSDAPGRARRLVQHGDIIWSTVRPNRRSYALILKPELHLVVSTGFAVLTATAVPYSYLYAAVTADTFADYLTNHATGSAYPAVTGKDFEKATLLMPTMFYLERFHEIVEPMLNLSWCLHECIANLRITRDLLLPKLICGEIPVEAADEKAAEFMEEIAQPA